MCQSWEAGTIAAVKHDAQGTFPSWPPWQQNPIFRDTLPGPQLLSLQFVNVNERLAGCLQKFLHSIASKKADR